jgi:hypothetical protein
MLFLISGRVVLGKFHSTMSIMIHNNIKQRSLSGLEANYMGIGKNFEILGLSNAHKL